MIKKWCLSLLFILAVSNTVFAAEAKDSCMECHKELSDELSGPVKGLIGDVHAKRGLSCVNCHGGDATSDDMAVAMSVERGFVGRPKRNEIPQFCAKCHSDPTYMRQFNPNLPTDQLAKYNTSQHGLLNAQGDGKVAVCISCHGVHGIRAHKDPKSSVFVSNIPATCGKCHADKEYMKGYDIPTTQLEEYKQSVHGIALLEKGDRSAPACNACHGNHEATPPIVQSVGNVCAQCHSLTRDYFAKSPHKAAHDKLGIPECEVCHGKHKILRPNDEWLGTGGEALCVNCHAPDSNGFKVATQMKDGIDNLKLKITSASELIEDVEKKGMEVDDAKYSLSEANNALTESRAVIHTFDAEKLKGVSEKGTGFSDKSKEGAEKALSDFKFRRKGFIVAIIIMFFLAFILYLEIKEADRKRIK